MGPERERVKGRWGVMVVLGGPSAPWRSSCGSGGSSGEAGRLRDICSWGAGRVGKGGFDGKQSEEHKQCGPKTLALSWLANRWSAIIQPQPGLHICTHHYD